MNATAATASPQRIEERTVSVGREIFDRLRSYDSRWRIASRERIERLALGLLMKDRELRYRALRFIDVYPALHSRHAIAAHFADYMTSPALALGRARTWVMGLTAALAPLAARFEGLTARASRTVIQAVGRQFIAGENPRSVAPRLKSLERRGFGFSIDLLGEFVTAEAGADEFARRYVEMTEGLDELLGVAPPPRFALPDSGPRVNVSIKLSSLTSKFDPMDPEGTTRSVLARLEPLARAARAAEAFLNIDMEKYEYRDLTLAIIRRLLESEEFAGYEHIGTVAQAYLADAEPSLESFLAWLRDRRQPMTIRLVKGAYWDSEQIWASQRGWPVPVLTEKRRCDAQFERMARRLLENHDLVRTAIASHNVRSLAHGIALAEELGVPEERFEAQMLFGMAGPIAKALLDRGIAVRIYVPCGELVPGMAYLVRRILENTANESFLRQRFVERAEERVLLADPKEAAA